MDKIRTKFCKTDLMKFISHLDLMRMMERSLRRSNVPLAFTQGFNPHPKIAFATALSIGVSSEGEYMDIEVTEPMDIDIFKTEMNKRLPRGLELLQCSYVDERSKALMAVIDYSAYLVNCKLEEIINRAELDKAMEVFLQQDNIFVSKVNKKKKKETIQEIDIRPLIRSIEIVEMKDNDLTFKMIVATGSKGNLKPEIVIDRFAHMMNIPFILNKTRIHRLELYILHNEKLTTPMEI